MLYFREKETEKLDSFLSDPSKKAMAVYGRRRTGKTELVLDYITKHPESGIVYFQCPSYDYQTCLEDFTAVLGQYGSFPSFSSFKDLFVYLDAVALKARCVVIDEFPFIAKKRESAAVEFQWIIDHGLKRIKLILLGSNMSFMENQLNNTEAPLYGRFDEILEIMPFRFSEVRTLFKSFDDAVQVYAQTGGVAQYVMMFAAYDSVDRASRELFFNKDGRLFHEASNLLMQELRDITVYTSILRAIGGAEKDSGQIAKKCGLDQRGVFAYLNKLISLRIVAPVDKVLSDKKSEKRYKIKDCLFRFSYTFLEPNLSMITAIGGKSMEFILGNAYSEYLGFVYEDMIREGCFEYALSGRIPFMPQTVGKWWGNICEAGDWHETEVDVVAFNETDVLIGECKYRNKAIGMKELELLRLKSEFIKTGGKKVHLMLAGKSGFTEELRDEKDIILINQF